MRTCKVMSSIVSHLLSPLIPALLTTTSFRSKDVYAKVEYILKIVTWSNVQSPVGNFFLSVSVYKPF
jgi:hypothetical protein